MPGASKFNIGMEIKGSLINVKSQMRMVLEMTAQEARNQWVKLARQRFHVTSSAYVNSIGDPVFRGNQVTITLRADSPEGKLANMLEQGSEPFDMKCLVSSSTKIYTSKGYVKIRDIKIGDLVLSHIGKMQRVLNISKEKNFDDFIYIIETKRSYVPVTWNHPILTNHGWIKACGLNPSLHKVIVLASVCNNCGKLFEYDAHPSRNYNSYCSKACAAKVNNDFRKENGRTDLGVEARLSIGSKMRETNFRLLLEGNHISQNQEWLTKRKKFIENGEWGWQNIEAHKKAKKAAAIALGKKHKFSDPESKLLEGLHKFGLDEVFDRQVFFKRDCLKPTGKGGFRNRWYFLDFGNLDLKICIEVNGEHWHTEEKIKEKTEEVESKGWRCINFWSSEIYSNLDSCICEIKRVLNNHFENYNFTETDFAIKKIKRNKFSNYGKYNITVENDSSFIASTIAVHNSGFLRSPKAKIGGKIGRTTNKYITIPLRLKSSGSMGGSPPVMPSTIYKKASQLEIGGRLTLSKKYEGLGLRTRLSADLKRWQHYTWKTSPFQNIVKVPRFTGLVKLGLPRESAGMYMVFRRVSKKSNPSSWIHPGFKAANLVDQVVSKVELMFPTIVNNIMGA